jgi:hypothetical protein
MSGMPGLQSIKMSADKSLSGSGAARSCRAANKKVRIRLTEEEAVTNAARAAGIPANIQAFLPPAAKGTDARAIRHGNQDMNALKACAPRLLANPANKKAVDGTLM